MNENITNKHSDCEPHDATNCDINDHSKLDPGSDDCGHRVESGPGVGEQKAIDRRPLCAPDPNAPSSANGDQDADNGPGCK